MEKLNQSSTLERGGCFRTTHWTVVLQAKGEGSDRSGQSLQSLFAMYWPPIYSFLRRQGHKPADAEDLTQAFFEHLIERDFLDHLHHRNGKFRSFLLTFLKNFLSDCRAKASAQKRGGGRPLLSLEEVQDEERRMNEPADRAATPEEAFERRWAETLMSRAIKRLEEEYREEGKGPLFESLKEVEPGERGEKRYALIAQQFGMSEAAVKSAAHRLRLRHRNLLRSEIAATIDDPAEVNAEINYLIGVLSR